MREGWICPSCKRGVSPDEKHCDHGDALRQGLPPLDRPLTGIGVGAAPNQFPLYDSDAAFQDWQRRNPTQTSLAGGRLPSGYEVVLHNDVGQMSAGMSENGIG